MKTIYLDNNATTGLATEVKEAMQEELDTLPANPSSIHSFGKSAKKTLTEAREQIASYLGISPHELLFTSGATESMNHLLQGFSHTHTAGHILTSDVEHSCIYGTLLYLQKKGWEVSFLPAGLHGAISVEQIEKAITPQTKLIVLGAANAETGVKHDIEKIAQLALSAKITFFVDAVALFGKEPFSIPEGVSGIVFSSHKIHGPKGVGATFLRRGTKITPLLFGGDQEHSLRAGTENLLGIVGFAKAVSLLTTALPGATQHMLSLRNHFESELKKKVDPLIINGIGPRVVNTSNVAFPHIDGETLLLQLDMAGVAASHGSACSSGALEPSRILLNMGLPKTIARSSLRFSFSRYTTKEETDRALQILLSLLDNLRKIS